AAVSAVVVARRRKDYWPAALALLALLVANVVAVPLDAALKPYQTDPWEGWKRVVVWIDGAVLLSSPATLAALCTAITSHHPRRAVAIVVAVWALASIALGAAYPHPFVRGESFGRILIAADLLGLLVSFGAIFTWGFRHRPPSSALAAALALICADLAIL